ncbi:MAG: M42 family metallopeptidase [Armatimonadota bacterium]|jgi:endoglucanase
MRKESVSFLQELVEAPSPSGFEQPAQRVVRDHVGAFSDEVRTDVHGNVIAAVNPGGSPRVMFAGHCDQVGMMVRFISKEGFVHFGSIGGIDPVILPGSRVTVHADKGPVIGVIPRKAVHLMRGEERGKAKVQMSDLYIDIGATSRRTAERRVAIGDPITYELGMRTLHRDIVASPGFDDKIGSFIVMEALRLLSRRKLRAAVFAVSTVQEELGLRGARTSCFGIDPLVGIAVDVTHATDYPGAEKKIGGDIRLGKGPVIERGANINPMVGELLLKAAKRKKIPHQIAGAPGATGTDANAMQISRAGVAAGLVSVPNRYMHTPVELVHLRDLTNAARLLAETTVRIDDKMDFVPR